MAAQLFAHLGAAQGAQKPWKILSILAIPGLRPRACGTARAPRRSVTQENICAVNRVTSQSARRPPITLQGALEILTAQTRGAATPLNLGAAQGAQKPWKILGILAIPGLRPRACGTARAQSVTTQCAAQDQFGGIRSLAMESAR